VTADFPLSSAGASMLWSARLESTVAPDDFSPNQHPRLRKVPYAPDSTFGGISVLRCYDENTLGKPIFGPSESAVQLDSFVQAFYNIQVDMPPGGALMHPPAGR
jgi:hypothetical protein